MENLSADKENFSPFLDAYQHNPESPESNEENCVKNVKILAESTLADLIAKKNALEENVKEKLHKRLRLQKEADERRNHTVALRQQTDDVEAGNIKLLEKLETLKAECAELKLRRSNIPMLTYEEQYEEVVNQLANLEKVAAMFSKFKSKDATENAHKTLTIQIDQLKMKASEEEEKVAELQNKIESHKTQFRSLPMKSLEAIGAALKRDLLDAENELRMQRK